MSIVVVDGVEVFVFLIVEHVSSSTFLSGMRGLRKFVLDMIFLIACNINVKKEYRLLMK